MAQAWGGPPPFAVELPRGPQGFGFSLWGGRDLNMGVYVRGLREGGPAQRCGRIQVPGGGLGGGEMGSWGGLWGVWGGLWGPWGGLQGFGGG